MRNRDEKKAKSDYFMTTSILLMVGFVFAVAILSCVLTVWRP